MIKKKIITICFVPCVLFIMFSLGGCGNQDEQVSPEPTNVKSFKIEKKTQTDGSVAKDKSPEGSVPDKPEAPQAASMPKAETPVSVTAKDSTATDSSSEVSPEMADQLPKPPEEQASQNKDDLTLSPAFEPDTSESQANGLIYNLEGKIDPFEPLFRARQEKTAEVSRKSQTVRDTRRNKLTPLEKMDISQLKLTAIIMGQQKNIAMVQESTGKGHVISTGTYIGINSGRVVEITKNTVIIEEEVEDLLGKIIVRKRELKLQKPLGEM